MAEYIFHKQSQQHFHAQRVLQNHATLKLMSPALDSCLTLPTISTEQNQKEHNTTDCLLGGDIVLNCDHSPVAQPGSFQAPLTPLGGHPEKGATYSSYSEVPHVTHINVNKFYPRVPEILAATQSIQLHFSHESF